MGNSKLKENGKGFPINTNKNKGEKTFEKDYKGLSINTNENKGQACQTQVLYKLHAHREDMLNKHSKVMQVRLDLHYPTDNSITPSSQHLEDFTYNLQRKLKREKIQGGHQVDPRLITVSEQNSSNNPHIHGVLLVNGNAKQNYYPLLQEAEQQWKQALKTENQGLVDYCNKLGENGIIMDRNKDDLQEKINECSYQASYLAKEKGKENKTKGSWLVKGTRLPKN